MGHALYQHRPLTLLTLPFPLKTVKDHSIKLMYNPRKSNTKDVSLVLSVGHGKKQSSSAQPLMSTYCNVEMSRSIEEKCGQKAEEWRQMLERDEEKKQQRMERCLARNTQSECEEKLMERMRQEVEEKKQECMRKEKSVEDMQTCLVESQSSPDMQSSCSKKTVMSMQKHSAITDIKKYIKKALSKMTGASQAVAMNIQASLHGTNHAIEKKMIAH